MNIKDKISDELNELWQEQFEPSPRIKAELALINKYRFIDSGEIIPANAREKWLKIIKGAFLFLPGVAFLFPVSLFMFRRFFDGTLYPSRLIVTLPFLFICGFAVMFGIGDIKNPKHLYIPLSVFAAAFFVFLVSTIMGVEGGWNFLANYSMYLFPLVFAVPVIVKQLIEKESEWLK